MSMPNGNNRSLTVSEIWELMAHGGLMNDVQWIFSPKGPKIYKPPHMG